MAWPTPTTSDYLSGEGAELVGQDMFDRDVEISHRGTSLIFADLDTTTTLQDVCTKKIRVPSYALTNAIIRLRIKAKSTGVDAGNYNARLREVDGPTNGTTIATTGIGAGWTYIDLDLTVPDDTWAGAVKNFGIQAQRPGGVDADSDWKTSGNEMALNLRFEAA